MSETPELRRQRLASTAIEVSHVLILWLRPGGEIVSVNDPLARELLTAPELLEGARVELLGTRFAHDFFAALPSLEVGSKYRYETEAVRSDGTPIALGVSASRAHLEGEAEPVCLLVAADLTAQRETLERLREAREMLFEAQKMEAIGRLAGGVAHDFNNLLAVIVGSIELIESGALPPGERAELCQEIRDAADRGARLTRQLLAFSRQQVSNPGLYLPSRLVADLGKLLRRMLGERVELRVDGGDVSSQIRIDPAQLEQVILNLAVNSRDAMPEGGVLCIRVRDRRLDLAMPSARDLVPAGDYVEIEVEDTGTGMSRETVARLFEPFFTTKERGRGTGLGLATVYGIVRQAGGYVALRTAPGKGTSFRLLFPLARPETQSQDADVRASPRPAVGQRVLYVEDDHDLRRLTSRVVRDLGFEVRVARDAHEARRLASEEPAFHLLLSDVVLPGLNGLELAKQLAAAQPSLRVLFVSGYAEDAEVLREIVSGRWPLLPKPFGRAALAAAIAAALEGPPFDEGLHR